MLSLIIESTKAQGGTTGQEERDIMFARLFGITAIVQSGLLLRTTTISTSSNPASSLDGFKEVVTELVALGEKKSWLRESSWWTIGLALDPLRESSVDWKKDAIDFTIEAVLQRSWSPEKVALVLKLQELNPTYAWTPALQPTFKSGDVLNTGTMQTLARILKVSPPLC
jgi:DNA polymerase phi